MTEYNQFIFSVTLVHSNIFRLRLIRAFFEAWFAQNEFLTELVLAISAVHFLFAKSFQYLNLVRFCSYFKLKLFYRCSLQWGKPFVDFFFHLRQISKQTLGNIKKNRCNFEQRERKYAVLRARGQKSFQKHSYCLPFVFTTLCFHSAFTIMRF